MGSLTLTPNQENPMSEKNPTTVGGIIVSVVAAMDRRAEAAEAEGGE
jgi:hypothetical protein